LNKNTKISLFIFIVGMIYLVLIFFTKIGEEPIGFILGLSGAIIHICISILIYKKNLYSYEKRVDMK